jgi:hypothetical protein
MSQDSSSAPHVLVSQESLAEDSDALLFSNVNVVNTMFSEHIAAEEIADAALRSYYVDFYASQMAVGGFAHFIQTSAMDEDVIAYITDGLAEMGATEHLALFKRFLTIFENLDEGAQEYFLGEEDLADEGISDSDVEDDYSDDDEDDAPEADDTSAYTSGRRLMDSEGPFVPPLPEEEGDVENIYAEEFEDLYDDEFDDLDEEFSTLNDANDLSELNAQWLRQHPDLLAVPEAEIEDRVIKYADQIPDIDERRSLAEAELDDGLEEHELLILELTDVAEQDLEEILGLDSDFEWDGETVSGWRFVTNEGEFIMIDNDDHALMIDVSTHEIIAELEFDDED